MSNIKYSYPDAVSILKSYGKIEKRGEQLVGCCPVCGDDHHLFIKQGDDVDVVAYCQKCNAKGKDIFAAWARDGHKPALVFTSDDPIREWVPGAVWYEYKTENGDIGFYKKRMEYYDNYPDGTRKRGKMTPYYHADKLKKGQPKACKDTLHIYNLYEAAQAEPGTLYIVEGEKCADALMKNGVLAITTKAGAKVGADTVKLTAKEQELVNRHVRIIIIPDNDEPGWYYAEAWSKYVPKLQVIDVKRLKPEAPAKYDIADWFADGGNVAELMQMEPVPYESKANPYAEEWNKVYSFDNPIDLSGGEPSGKEVALMNPLPTPEMEEELDPGEWQREDFRNREKLNALFDHIYLNKDSFLLEVFKDRARELKVVGMAKLWTEYEKARDKQINASEIAKKKSKLIPLVEAGSLRTGAYTISVKGVIKEVAKKEEIFIIEVISVPVLPVSILTNVETGTVRTRLWWKHENRPAHEEIVENRILADRSKILMLASRGLPVDSTNALDVVEYLSVIAAKNDDIIPHDESVSSLGWHNNNKFSPYDPELIIDNITENNTVFQSIKSKGTLEEWVAFMAPHMADKRFHVVMAASFGSVILRLVGALPFILHFWGKTGTGKTVGLMAAASVWGNPAPGAYLRSMDATTNAIMRIAGFLRNLPVIADEMQTVRDKEGNYDKFIMRVSEGVERSRLNSDSSLRPLQEWNCIFICSGEEPIVSIRSGAGAVNRVIEVELEASEPLFPGSLGNEVANFCRDHYGAAGPEFVNHIKALEPDTLRTMYNDSCKTLTAEKLSAKQALSAAAILTASQVISTLIFCDKVKPLQPDDIIPYLKTELTVDPAERAYTALMNRFAANRNRFMSKTETQDAEYHHEPIGEIWGKFIEEKYGQSSIYAVNKGILERELQDIGFQFNAVKKAWADKGYLQKNSQGLYFHQRNEHGTRVEYVYVVNMPE